MSFEHACPQMFPGAFQPSGSSAKVSAVAQGGRLRETGRTGVITVNDLVLRARDDERGMATAEYAVGMCAATGIGGLLLSILTSAPVRELLMNAVEKAFSVLLG